MHKHFMKVLPPLAVAGILATGCTAEGPEVSDPAESTDFRSLDELVSAWEEFTGDACVDPGGIQMPENTARCSHTDVVGFFGSTAERDESLKRADKQLQEVGVELTEAVGDDWAVVAVGFDHEGFVRAHGGEVKKIGGAK